MRRNIIITIALAILLCGMYNNYQIIESHSNSVKYLSSSIDNLNKVNNNSLFEHINLDSIVVVAGSEGYGSGVVIDSNLILTAGHVIDTNDLYVVDYLDREYKVISKWRSNKYDIGLIEINNGELLPAANLGKMPYLIDNCYLIGAPYSRSFVLTITKGIISYVGRDWYIWNDLIQTDAKGAHGSSGCPLLDVRGNVIGICVAGSTNGGGVTLCEPITHIREVLDEYLREK